MPQQNTKYDLLWEKRDGICVWDSKKENAGDFSTKLQINISAKP